MKLVVDMNLSPDWVAVLQRHGREAVHWSTVGNPRATDPEIMAWAKATGHVVFTHDLGFGGLLAATDAGGPSVIQVRTQDVTPAHLESAIRPCHQNFQPRRSFSLPSRSARSARP